jgi:hypothetical protein
MAWLLLAAFLGVTFTLAAVAAVAGVQRLRARRRDNADHARPLSRDEAPRISVDGSSRGGSEKIARNSYE